MSKTSSSIMLRRSFTSHWHSPLARRKNMTCRQSGVVLIVALIMLVVISLLATLSIRNAVSSESTSGNVRTTQLATQAAEIALRYCEEYVAQYNASLSTTATVTLSPVPDIQTYQDPPLWKTLSNWDAPATPPLAFSIPSSSVNQGGTATTFKRVPECMVERIPARASDGTINTTSTFVITARGFGPEVPAGTGRPTGSEVWLQSTIEP
jgi:type IV pilus assembly protein PilX